jgi:hypothetical protein
MKFSFNQCLPADLSPLLVELHRPSASDIQLVMKEMAAERHER